MPDFDAPSLSILNAISSGVVVTDADGRLSFLNPEAERILRRSSQDAVGRPLSEVAPGLAPYAAHCLATGSGTLGQLLHNAGTDLLASITPLKNGDGSIGTVCNFQELRIYENIAKQLDSYKQINAQLESIINSSVDGLWIIDSDGSVLRMNKASEEIHGFRMSDVVGLHVLELERRGLIEKVVSDEVLNTKKKVTQLTTVKGRQVLATGSPVLSEPGEILFVLVNERDMTELNALRRQSENSQMQMAKYKEELNKISMLELEEHGIVAESPSMLETLRTALKLAQIGVSNVFIRGESGTGKGLLAKYIHSNSKRKNRPFIQINCAAIPENLLESELFGYERGAFTGAMEQGKAGLIELAHEGTLFLDEIGDMPLQIQAKVLNFLDDGMVRRLGGSSANHVDCIVLAATNRDMEQLADKLSFRKDLLYRLNSFPIHLLPLHERPDDIPPLVMHFISSFNQEYGLNRYVSPATLARLQSRRYHGNVRELRSLIKRAMVLSKEDAIDPYLLFDDATWGSPQVNLTLPAQGDFSLKQRLDAVEKALLAKALEDGRTTRQIAALFSLNHSTVVRKLHKHGLSAIGAKSHQRQ